MKFHDFKSKFIIINLNSFNSMALHTTCTVTMSFSKSDISVTGNKVRKARNKRVYRVSLGLQYSFGFIHGSMHGRYRGDVSVVQVEPNFQWPLILIDLVYNTGMYKTEINIVHLTCLLVYAKQKFPIYNFLFHYFWFSFKQ